MCACGLEFLKTLVRIFVMFVNEEVCEIVLIIGSSTDYENGTIIRTGIRLVIKRPTDSTTSNTSGQTDTTSGQTSTTSGQTSSTSG